MAFLDIGLSVGKVLEYFEYNVPLLSGLDFSAENPTVPLTGQVIFSCCF